MEYNELSDIIENNMFDKTTEKKIGWMVAFGVCFVIAILVVVFFRANGYSAKIKKILKENNYYDFKVVETCPLGEKVKGLTGENTLVLLKNENGGVTRYGMGAVNIEAGTVTDIAFGYGPLNIVIDKIFLSDESTNIRNLKCASNYIKMCGFDCFENYEYAKGYLEDITDEDGIIDTQSARQAIIDSIWYILPDIEKSEDYTVIFEGSSANPMYYAAKSYKSRYNWSGIMPESHYNFLGREYQQRIASIYGPAYSMQDVWAVVDTKFKEVGVYNTKEEMEKALKTK